MDSTLFKVISPGDRILKINNDRAIKFFNKTKDLLSGSLQWKESKALTTYLNGTEKEKIQLKFSHQHKSLKRDFSRTFPASSYRAGKESSYQTQTGWIRPGVYYFDLTKLALDSLHISNFLKATAIIFDLRGYPVNDNIFDLIPMLLNSARAIKRIYGLKILLPDFEKMQYKTQFDNYLPSQTHIRAKTFFLTDATAQSASESLLGLVKDFKLGTIIGTPTSGTNGNINILSLPGRYRITFTGMLVKNGDGSKHHLLGIQPDIRASRTLDSYKRKSDNVLKLAIELTKEKK